MKLVIGTMLRAKSPLIALLLMGSCLFSQNGTYELKNKNGSYCYISFEKSENRVIAEIFAWWNTPSGQTGSYFGRSRSNSNPYILTSDENEPSCRVTLQLSKNNIVADFDRCTVDHLTEDFNGTYTKISDATSGEYVVSATRSYFHKKPAAGTEQRAYLIKGNKVTLNLDSITAGDWAYVYYVSQQGKEYKGYVRLRDLTKVIRQ